MIWGLLIPSWRRRVVLWLAGAVVAVLGIFMAGKREARRDAKTKAAEATVKALKDRERIDDDISQDTDLAARARKSGIVRPCGE